MINRIAIVGAGNVAWHLAHALKDSGFEIAKIHSRTPEKGKELAASVSAQWVDAPDKIKDVDMVLVAVSDDQTASVCETINTDLLIAHTSGMTHLESISRKRKASFYPLQTFSKDKDIDLKNVPFCIEASNKNDFRHRLDAREGRKQYVCFCTCIHTVLAPSQFDFSDSCRP